ncbi:hypothetical protein QFC21_004928 [Naganishia friedmannii]|uniref:Uncharacterized protein n=1 Tax=Naganishia friedmannii TaxID=89922 RepID=A0ACC2VE58_9TREE|nr:hypothetical protein QFC21_004928 [Naganishia friedmannii]
MYAELRNEVRILHKEKTLAEEKTNDIDDRHHNELDNLKNTIADRERRLRVSEEENKALQENAKETESNLCQALETERKERMSVESKMKETDSQHLLEKLSRRARKALRRQQRGSAETGSASEATQPDSRDGRHKSKLGAATCSQSEAVHIWAGRIPTLPNEIHTMIAGFLSGVNAFGSLASYNVISRSIHQVTVETLYETVILDSGRQLDGISKPTTLATDKEAPRSQYRAFLPKLCASFTWGMVLATSSDEPDLTSAEVPLRHLEIIHSVYSPVFHHLLRSLRLRFLKGESEKFGYARPLDAITSVDLGPMGWFLHDSVPRHILQHFEAVNKAVKGFWNDIPYTRRRPRSLQEQKRRPMFRVTATVVDDVQIELTIVPTQGHNGATFTADVLCRNKYGQPIQPLVPGPMKHLLNYPIMVRPPPSPEAVSTGAGLEGASWQCDEEVRLFSPNNTLHAPPGCNM